MIFAWHFVPRRFGVRTLMIAMVVACCLFGVIGIRLHRARLQRGAVEDLQTSGYTLRYDFQFSADVLPTVATLETMEEGQRRRIAILQRSNATPPPASWPMSLLPVDARHAVVYAQASKIDELRSERLAQLQGLEYVQLSRVTLSDDDWQSISRLRTLKVLQIASSELDGHALSCIAHLGELEYLLLPRSSIDSAGLDELSGLRGLKYLSLQGCELNDSLLAEAIDDLRFLECLDLSSTSISDDSIKAAATHPNIVALSLRDTGITDEGIASVVSAFPNLERLDVSNTRISDEACIHIGKLAHLQTLFMQDTAVDEGLVHLKQLKELQHLDLSFTDASDAGVAHLQGLDELSWLNVRGPIVTNEMARQLGNSLPNCRVVH